MLKYRNIFLAIGFLLLAGFAFGLVSLFELRFEGGDIYPPYSSLRSDPLGTMALCQSLEALPDLSVTRSYKSWPDVQRESDCALLLLGVDIDNLFSMPQEDFQHLQQFMFAGGRVVISLLPVVEKHSETNSSRWRTESDPNNTNGPPSKLSRKSDQPEKPGKLSRDESEFSSVSLPEKAGFTVRYDNLAIDDDGLSKSESARAVNAAPAFEPEISWHTAAYFDGLAQHWRTLYLRKDHPVMIERSYGSGTLVLSADSYFLSNEALRRERHPQLLAWLAGDKREIIFDETHLGVEEKPGVASLLRRYRLHGLLAGLLLLAALFIWKNSASLAPRREEGQGRGGDAVTGKQSIAGFINLLRRNIAGPDVLLTCFNEWKSSCGRDPRAASRLGRIQEIIDKERVQSARLRQPVESYRAIQQVLTQKD